MGFVISRSVSLFLVVSEKAFVFTLVCCREGLFYLFGGARRRWGGVALCGEC